MLREGESSLPREPQDAWVSTWTQISKVYQTPPGHVQARIALEKGIWNTGQKLSHEADSFFHQRVVVAKRNITAISKEWGLSEHVNIMVRQTPEVFLRTSYGSGYTRSDVVRMMDYEHPGDEEYQALEEGVMQQVMRREAKLSQRRKP